MSNANQSPEALRLFELEQNPAEQVAERIADVAPIIEEFGVRWNSAVEAEKKHMAFCENHPEICDPQILVGHSRQDDTVKLLGRDVATTTSRQRTPEDPIERHQKFSKSCARLMGQATESARLEQAPMLYKRLLAPVKLSEVETFVEGYHIATESYGLAYISQDVVLNHLLPLAQDPSTARALLDYVAAQAATEERIPGLLEILATNHIADTPERVVQRAIDTLYNDTAAHVPRIFGEWLDTPDLNQSRLRREVVCSLQVMRLLIKDIVVDDTREALLRTFGANTEAWPSELRTEYEKVVNSLRAKEQYEIEAVLKPHERRSRLPETRSFRTKGKSSKKR